MRTREHAVLGVVVAAGAGLHLTAAPPTASLQVLRGADSVTDPVQPLLAVLSLAAQALWLWLAAAVLVVLAARLPGLAGQAGRCLSRLVVPAVLRHAVEVALGLSVTVGALGAAPAAAAPLAHPASAPAPPAASAGTSEVPDLEWPSSGGGLRTPVTAPPSPATAAPRAAATPPAPPAGPVVPRSAARSTARSPAPPAAPPRTAPAPTTPAPRPTPPPHEVQLPSLSEPAQPQSRRTVVVQPGDTLWELAEAALERTGGAPPSAARVALAWPTWWSANRAVIGDDPHLILPGTSLTPPDDGSARASS